MRYTKILFLYQEQYSLKLLFVATENQSEGVIKLVDKNPIVSIIILIVNRQLKGSYCENGWRLKKKTPQDSTTIDRCLQETHYQYRHTWVESKCMEKDNT